MHLVFLAPQRLQILVLWFLMVEKSGYTGLCLATWAKIQYPSLLRVLLYLRTENHSIDILCTLAWAAQTRPDMRDLVQGTGYNKCAG